MDEEDKKTEEVKPSETAYTLLSFGKFTQRAPLRRDIDVRLGQISDKLGVPKYRIIDAFLELCVTRFEEGNLTIKPGTIPAKGSRRGSNLGPEDYDDEVLQAAEQEFERLSQTPERIMKSEGAKKMRNKQKDEKAKKLKDLSKLEAERGIDNDEEE